MTKTNGNDKTVLDDFHAAQSSLWRAERIIRTAYKAIEASQENDNDDVIEAVTVLGIGLDELQSAFGELEIAAGRLFREGSPAADLAKIDREATPPAIRILRSSRTPASKVKALEKVMRVGLRVAS